MEELNYISVLFIIYLCEFIAFRRKSKLLELHFYGLFMCGSLVQVILEGLNSQKANSTSHTAPLPNKQKAANETVEHIDLNERETPPSIQWIFTSRLS